MLPSNAFDLDHEDGDDDGGDAAGFLSLRSLASSSFASSSSMASMASMSSLLDPASALNFGLGGALHFHAPPATVSSRLPWLPAIATQNTSECADTTGAFRVTNGTGVSSYAGQTVHHGTAAADRSQTVATRKPTLPHTAQHTETNTATTQDPACVAPPGSMQSNLQPAPTATAPPNDKAPRSLTETAAANRTLPSQAQALHEQWILVRGECSVLCIKSTFCACFCLASILFCIPDCLLLFLSHTLS
jgi:hypothetical protein